MLLLNLFLASAWAQGGIGVIDLGRVFDHYYKTVQAEARLKERAKEADKVFTSLREDHRKAVTEYNKLMHDAQDQALSPPEKTIRNKRLEAKLKEVQELEKNAVKFQQQTKATFDEERGRFHVQFLNDIKQKATVKAKAAGLALLFDSSAEGFKNLPVMIDVEIHPDFTEELLNELNAGAASASEAPSTDRKPGKTERKK